MMTRDPYKYFRIEARELLDQLGKGILDLENGSSETDLVTRLLRLAHTLKGAARVVKQSAIAELAHSVEDTLAPLRGGTAELSRASINGVLSLLDAIALQIAALAEVATVSNTAGGPVAEQHFGSFGENAEDLDTLLDGVLELNVQLGTLRRGVSSLKHLRHLTELLNDRMTLPRGQGEASQGRQAGSIAEEVLGLVVKIQRQLCGGIDQLDSELRQVRGATERLRLLPAGLIFNSLERALRDAAHSVGARVGFEGTGGEVRLEPHVLATIQDALVQVMRNAAAHGIESATDRAAAGKPAEGRVRLEVKRRGSQLSFACSDDGRGVDLEAIRRVAQSRTDALQTAKLDATELLALILKGGISTSNVVTEVSGRGIGLDVVREAATRLGGEVTVRTDAGKGTTVEILIPVSLSALEALVVESGGQTAAIPLTSVRRTMRLSAVDVTRTAEGESILLEGKAIPFASLSQALQPKSTAEAARGVWSAVVIESRGVLATIGVDELLGVESIVLRPLPKMTPTNATVAGASLDAEGNPQMVLDPEGIVAAVRRRDAGARLAASARLPILIIDDSLTTRMLEQSILESAGYEIEIATSAEEGLEKANRRGYGLFLVDVEMPGMDGFDFVRRIRATPALSTVPAILVTSRNSAEDRQQGVESGAQGYVVKSEFDQGDLLNRIRQLVE
jgi:two-component system chemotaxis sensor kinase CheA